MEDLSLVAYCGLHCDLCAQRCRIPKQAAQLRDSLQKEGCEYWGGGIAGFEQFWEVLNQFSDSGQSCPGCRQGGGFPDCEIRRCAKERNVEVCPRCSDFPCDRVKKLGKVYPTLIPDGRRLKRIGLAAWIQEQNQRGATGFAHADIRCPRD